MSQKFDKLLNEFMSRYETYGFSPGDQVVLKKDALNHKYFQRCDKRYIDTLKACMNADFGYNMFLASSPITLDGVYGVEDEPICMVRVEFAPGSSGDHMRVPCSVLQVVDNGINTPSIPDKLKHKNRDSLKPEEIKHNSTVKFDTNLINKNIKLAGGEKWDDGKPGGGNTPKNYTSK